MKNLKAIIEGKQIPNGKVKVSGAKNAATRLLAASLISDGEVILENFPTELVDARHKMNFIRKSEGNVEVNELDETVIIDPSDFKDVLLSSYDYPIRKIGRASCRERVETSVVWRTLLEKSVY